MFFLKWPERFYREGAKNAKEGKRFARFKAENKKISSRPLRLGGSKIFDSGLSGYCQKFYENRRGQYETTEGAEESCGAS